MGFWHRDNRIDVGLILNMKMKKDLLKFKEY
jgi:hypothetical protein